MSRYDFTVSEGASIVVNGQRISLVPDRVYGTDDPCEFLDIFSAWQQELKMQGKPSGYTEEVPGLYEQAVRECTGKLLEELLAVEIPDGLPHGPGPDPSALDGQPPDGTDAASTTGAPDPPVSGNVATDGRQAETPAQTPGERLYDPNNPATEGDIANEAADAGLTPDQVADEIERARRNAPLEGERHPHHSADRRADLDATVDPVAIFSGQFTLDQVDAEIASVGMPLRLQRVYRSGTVYFGPWGFQWDHNYNVYLRPLKNGHVAVWTGRIHEEVYEPNAAGGFEPPLGTFRRLEHQPATAIAAERWTITERGGLRFLLERPAGWPEPSRVPLVQIEDRHGNCHDLTYDAQGRLEQVSDAFGRFLRFHYGGRGLLEQVTDQTGRLWRYYHHPEVEHLVRVVGPATDEYQDGRATCYEYDERQPHPALRHNLTAIIDGDAYPVVFNTYGADPASDDFGRVVRQDLAGEVSLFTAERLQRVPRMPEAINVPALRVTVDDPGTIIIYTFNYRGDVLDKRYRLSIDKSYRLVPEAFRYDEQGNLVEHFLADGRGMAYEYDITNSDPRARGSLLRGVQFASPLKPAPSVEVFRGTYEPQYWQLKTARDTAGQTTTFIYDYEVSPIGKGVGDLVELRRPSCTQPDGVVVPCVETFQYTPQGQLARHDENGAVHEFFYAGPGPDEGYLVERRTSKATHVRRERYERDATGNITAKIDGVGNRTVYQLDAFNLVRQVTNADGSIWSFRYDAAGRLRQIFEPRGDYDDPTLAGAPIRHDFTYTPTGYLIEEVFAANTATPRRFTYKRSTVGKIVEQTDPTGRRVTYRNDERGLTLEETTFDGNTVMQIRRFTYERTGELRRLEVVGGPVVLSEHDGFGRLSEFTDPAGTRYVYTRDNRGLVTQTDIIGQLGSPGSLHVLLARQRQEYNEAGALRRCVDVLFDNPAGPFTDLVTEFWRDAGQLVTKVHDPRGFEETYTYTGQRTLATQEDLFGNRTRWTYDAAGRVSTAKTREVSTGGMISLMTESVSYDPVGRVIDETDPIGNIVRYQHDGRGMLCRAINPAGTAIDFRYNAHREIVKQTLNGATMQWQRDDGGRASTLIDPAGATTVFVHDVMSRLRRVTRPDGLIQDYAYDVDGSLHSFTDYDGTRVDYVNTSTGLPERLTPIPGPGVAPTAPIQYAYDGLRRLVRADHGGSTVTRRFDSIGRLLEESANGTLRVTHDPAGLERLIEYPDGRRDLQRFDALGRLIEARFEAAGALPLTAHGLAPGTTIAAFEWAGKHRLGGVQTLGALSATLNYDGAARLVDGLWSQGGAVVYGQTMYRDALGLARAERRVNGIVTEQAYDLDVLTRLSTVKLDLPGGALPPTPVVLTQPEIDAAVQAALLQPAARTTTLAYTAGDTPAQRTDVDGGGAVLTAHVYGTNALHQITSVDGVPVGYDLRGNVTAHGVRKYSYDAFRRLVEVSDAGVPVAQFYYDALGRAREWDRGGVRTAFTYFGHELLHAASGGTVVAQYVPGPRPDQPIVTNAAGGSYVLVHDAAGSLVAACSLAGAVAERYRYDVFGEPQILGPGGAIVLPASAIGLAPNFHGRPWIAEAGLYDFRSRHFDPRFLGFLQPDPIAFAGSWNPYAFVSFNPYSYTDQYGAWITIVAGAIIGSAIGGIGAALSGGDLGDILVAAGAGAVGGALTGAGMPIAGAAVAGGIMGAWSGGRIGYEVGGTEGAVVGALGGGVVGAGLGTATGFVGSRVGNAVGTRVYGAVFNYARRHGVRAATATVASRTSGMVVGGYAGGATAGVFGNTTSTVIVDVATGNEVTLDQLGDAALHGVTIDGALGAVGATAERYALVASIPRRTGHRWGTNIGFNRNVGLESELLVGRAIGVEPAVGGDTVVVNGRTRHPDFPINETVQRMRAVVEVKHKTRLSTSGWRSDVDQITDFATVATGRGANEIVYVRPGMDTTPLAGIDNVTTLPIPQQPFVLPIPLSFKRREDSSSEAK